MLKDPVSNDPSNPLISVLIYNYDGEHLGRCLDSILSQTVLDNIEIIFIDNASTDGSWEIAVDYCAIARLNAEAKHRSLPSLRIVDLTIFSYFSRFADLTDGYFITETIDSILKGRMLITDPNDMVRDYLHPDDLFDLVVRCIEVREINRAFDAISSRPVSKNELLDFLRAAYGLIYLRENTNVLDSATGAKSIYCSAFHGAASIGHIPCFSSLDTIRDESKQILTTIY